MRFFILILLLLIPINLYAEFNVLAFVGNDVVSNIDLHNRLKLIVYINKIADPAQIKDQILQNLINESLYRQEAAKLNISITDQQVDAQLLKISNNIKNINKLKSALKTQSLDFNSLRNKITAQLLHTELIKKQIIPYINISDQDAKEFRTQINNGSTVFDIQQIVINENIGDKFVYNLVNELRHGKDFAKAISRFSMTRYKVNHIINKYNAPQILYYYINKLNINDISDPILYNHVYYIIKLINKYHINFYEGNDIVTFKQLVVKNSDDKLKKLYNSSNNCTQLDANSKTLRLPPPITIENEKMDNLAINIREILQNHKKYISHNKTGMRIIMLCKKNAEKNIFKDDTYIKNLIFNDAISKQEISYLQNLKSHYIVKINEEI